MMFSPGLFRNLLLVQAKSFLKHACKVNFASSSFFLPYFYSQTCTKHAWPRGIANIVCSLPVYTVYYIYKMQVPEACVHVEQKAGCRWCKKVICFHF